MGSSSEQQATKEELRGGRAAPAARNVKLGGRRAAVGSPARQKPSAYTSSGTPVGQKPMMRRGGRGGGEASTVAACEDMSGKAGVGLGEGGSAKSSDRTVRLQGGGGGEGQQAKSRSLPGERRSAPNKGLHAAVGKSASLERGKVNPVVSESKGDARKPGERLLAKLSGLREKKAEVLTPHLTGSHQPFFQGINAPCSLPTSPRKITKRRHDSSAGCAPATSFKRRRQGLSLLPAIDPCTGRRRNLSTGDAEAIAGAVAGGDTKLLSTFYPDFPLGPVVYTVWERGEVLGSKEKMLKHRFVRPKPSGEQQCGVWARAGSEDNTACDRSEAGAVGSFRPVAGSGPKVSSAGGRTEKKTAAVKTGLASVSCESEAGVTGKSDVKLTSEPIKGAPSTGVEGDGRGRSPPMLPHPDLDSMSASEKAVGQPTVIAVRGTPGN